MAITPKQALGIPQDLAKEISLREQDVDRFLQLHYRGLRVEYPLPENAGVKITQFPKVVDWALKRYRDVGWKVDLVHRDGKFYVAFEARKGFELQPYHS
jgi:hypothetical protein